MPWAAPVASVIGAGLGFIGQNNSNNQQQQQSDAALQLAKDQAAQQQRNYEQQQQALAAQWQARQAAQAPYRAMAASIFAKYGLKTPKGGWGGGAMPPGWNPGAVGTPPGAVTPPPTGRPVPYVGPMNGSLASMAAMPNMPTYGAPAAPGSAQVSPYAAEGELAGLPPLTLADIGFAPGTPVGNA